MSDHGTVGYVGGVPDIRWNDDDLACIKSLTVGDLEVVNNSMLEVSSISGQTKPYVVPATLAGGTSGDPYSATFSAVGGNPATIQWSVSSGALPPGLVLNATTGAISGLISSSASGAYTFNVTAADTASGYSSAAQSFSITVKPFIVSIASTAATITSVPAGLQVTVDGTTYATPQNFTWTQGSSHTLSTTSPQGTGTRYVFANWSDGGAQSHTVTAPATATATYTANFSAQYLLTAKVSPSGAGAIAASPASSNGYYNAGTSVQLTATAAAGHEFSVFSGDLTGSANPQSLVMSAPHAVTADFVPVPKFSLEVEHTGAFTDGETNATYTVLVSNTSSSATSGAVTVRETLPAGMTMVSMAGSGWTCPSGGTTCTRSDSLGGGAAYPGIVVTVNVSANAKSPEVNTVSVSGGGAATVTATNTTDIRK